MAWKYWKGEHGHWFIEDPDSGVTLMSCGLFAEREWVALQVCCYLNGQGMQGTWWLELRVGDYFLCCPNHGCVIAHSLTDDMTEYLSTNKLMPQMFRGFEDRSDRP
jgi:hypothetical protein